MQSPTQGVPHGGNGPTQFVRCAALQRGVLVLVFVVVDDDVCGKERKSLKWLREAQ